MKVVPAGQVVTLALGKGAPRTGRVVDTEGRPGAKAHVTLQSDDYVVSMGTAGDDGRFTVFVTPGGRLIRATAFAMSPDGTRLVADLEKDVVPQEGEIVLRLEPVKER